MRGSRFLTIKRTVYIQAKNGDIRRIYDSDLSGKLENIPVSLPVHGIAEAEIAGRGVA